MPVSPTKLSPTIVLSYKLHRARVRTPFIMVPCIPAIVSGSINTCGMNERITLQSLWEKSRNASFSHCFPGGLWPGSLSSHPLPSFRKQPFHCRDRKGDDTKEGLDCLCFLDYVCHRNSHYHGLVVSIHGPWLQISFPTFWSWSAWIRYCIANTLKNYSDREWFTSVNTQLHKTADPLPVSIWHRTGWSWTAS